MSTGSAALDPVNGIRSPSEVTPEWTGLATSAPRWSGIAPLLWGGSLIIGMIVVLIGAAVLQGKADAHRLAEVATTNLTTPLAGWTVLSTGVFGGSPVTYSDLTATNYPARFYTIMVP